MRWIFDIFMGVVVQAVVASAVQRSCYNSKVVGALWIEN
jgi:hypothetical protein